MEKEYDPLLKDGFQEIALWQLDKVFLEPFGENEHRKMLIDRLKVYLTEVEAIRLPFEVWIDGSFSTEKPEPTDVDLVLLFDRDEVDSLAGVQSDMFQNLIVEREEIKARYNCDVFFIDGGNEAQKNTWQNTFGKDSRKVQSKGIFRVKFGGRHA